MRITSLANSPIVNKIRILRVAFRVASGVIYLNKAGIAFKTFFIFLAVARGAGRVASHASIVGLRVKKAN